jgi:hypothetical protein
MKFISPRDDYDLGGGLSNAPMSGIDIMLMLIDGTSLLGASAGPWQ